MSAGVSSLLSFALCVGGGTVCARTVSIASSDKATGAVSLTVSPGGADESPKPLIAAWAPGEIGTSPTNACDWAFVGLVDAETTDVAFAVPGVWRTKSGTVRFFLMREQPPYTRRFACLRTPAAGPYIDTGVVPDADTDVSVTASYPSDMAPFGVSGKLYFFSNSSDKEANGTYYCGFFDANNGGRGFNAPRGSEPRTFRINSTGAIIDGTRYSVMFDPATITETTTSTLTLFARKNDGQMTVGKQGDVSIYAAQIRQAGTLTHDYVPCETANGVKTLRCRLLASVRRRAKSRSYWRVNMTVGCCWAWRRRRMRGRRRSPHGRIARFSARFPLVWRRRRWRSQSHGGRRAVPSVSSGRPPPDSPTITKWRMSIRMDWPGRRRIGFRPSVRTCG